jgi:hypothetical protein
MVRTCGTTEEHPSRMLKKATFSPSQPWRLFHPPALSLPRQPLRPGTRLVPSKTVANYHFMALLLGEWVNEAREMASSEG